jgi:hypothetical protein
MLKLHRLLVGLVAAMSLVAIAGSGGVAHAQTPAPCPTGLTLAVAPPAAGAPTTVTVTLTPPVTIKSPADADPASYHLHYFVDTPALDAGTLIPAGDPQIIHSISLVQDLGELAAGSHEVTVVLGQFNHSACEARGSATFTVAEPAPASAGNAGLTQGGGSPLVSVTVAALAMLALAFVAAGRLGWLRR